MTLSPKTWLDGEHVTAAMLNAEIRDPLKALSAQQDQFQLVTPTIDELSQTVLITTWQSGTNPPTGVSGTQLSTIWIAPFPCRITAITCAWDYYNKTADDVNYLNVFFRRINSATTTFVAKNTKVTGGEPIVARTPWRYNGASWDTTVATFAEGDLLGMQVALNGTTTMQFPMTVTWKYAPL